MPNVRTIDVAALAMQIFLLGSATLTPLTVAILTFVNQRNAAKVEKRAAQAEQKAEEVKNTLQKTNAASAKQLGAIHTLVNSQMGRQLTLYAVAARRLAEQTDNLEDIAAADSAERELREHQAKQKAVDALNARDAH